MEAEPLPRLLILLPLLLSHLLATAATSTAAASPTPPPMPPPSPTTIASASTTLDPKQLTALQSIGVPTAHDPCATPSPHNATACDAATPFRHLISLRLANCSADVSISLTAIRALSTLRTLSFLHCPIPPPHHLPPSLTSFSATSSLRRLTGVYLSRLHNLSSLTIIDVPIAASGPWIILSGMPHLRSLTVSNANLSGGVPHHWHAAGLVTVDLSANRLTGAIPSSIGLLSSLTTLNLSSNTLTGAIPDAIGDAVAITTVDFSHNSLSGPIPDSISGLSALTHFDLSSNRFNGSIPRFLSEMGELRHLNFEDNDLQGVLPFNASFIKRLEVFKVGGNGNLCYNRTVLPAKLGLGIAPCDKYGLPVSPPPDRTTHAESPSDYDDDDSEGGLGGGRKDGGGHGRNRVVLGVAIALSCFVFLVIFIVCISKMCR